MAVGKQKTRKSVSKRIRITGSGKLVRRKAGVRHRLVAKSSKAKGRAGQDYVLASGDARNVRRALQGAL